MKKSKSYDEEYYENEMEDRNFIDMVTSKLYLIRSLLQFKGILPKIFRNGKFKITTRPFFYV